MTRILERPEEYDQCSCGAVKKCRALVCRKCFLASRRTHGHSHTSLIYRTWQSMWQRCTNPNAFAYHRYGGRGISVCERWRQYENFLADMGEKPFPHYSLDRIDNNGNYEPSNCRWADNKTQASNREPTFIDLTGSTYGRLTVMKLSHINSGTYWHVTCECGTKTVIKGASFRYGSTQSCGCLRTQRVSAALKVMHSKRREVRDLLATVAKKLDLVDRADHRAELQAIRR